MPNSIHYSLQALQDLDEIFDYIAIEKQNPIAAQNTIQVIRKSISDLKTLDNLGVKLFLPSGQETQYRFVQYKNFLSFYRVSGTDFFIDRILYGKRDYIRILFRTNDEQEKTWQ